MPILIKKNIEKYLFDTPNTYKKSQKHKVFLTVVVEV